MKIEKMYNSAIGAFYDRLYISRGKKNISRIDLNYYNILERQSGPSVHGPINVMKSWYKAYLHNMDRYDMIERLQKPFHKKSTIWAGIRKIISHR
jgi:hypothetical protein